MFAICCAVLLLYVVGGLGTCALGCVLDHESSEPPWAVTAVWPLALPVMLVAATWRAIGELRGMFS